MQAEDLTSRLNQLRAAHQEADAKLRQLDRHVSLSPEEQLEIVRLKKQKLHLKDEIRSLSAKLTEH